MFVLVLIILILIILCIILGQKPPTPPYYSTLRKNMNIVTTENNNNVIDYKKYYKANCRIKLCIELDDSTHNKKARIERDEFINKLFKDLEINLLRYPVYQIYYKETLKRKIQEVMKDHYYAN